MAKNVNLQPSFLDEYTLIVILNVLIPSRGHFVWMTDPVVYVEAEKLAKPNMTIFYKWTRVKRPVSFFKGVILAQRDWGDDQKKWNQQYIHSLDRRFKKKKKKKHFKWSLKSLVKTSILNLNESHDEEGRWSQGFLAKLMMYF